MSLAVRRRAVLTAARIVARCRDTDGHGCVRVPLMMMMDLQVALEMLRAEEQRLRGT